MSSLYYKYRALEPWVYLLDIFVNERLFAAKFDTLNDPMEGMFTYSERQESPGFIKMLVEEKAKLGICSLSRKLNSTLMWSYYAAGHQGVVLGLEIVEKGKSPPVVSKVQYAKDISFRGFYGSDAETEARKILSKKLSAWGHEDEVRAFTRSKFVPIKLRQVILGCQMTPDNQKLMTHLLQRTNPDVEVTSIKRADLDR